MDLRPDHLAVVKEILKNRVPFAEVRAFGSRVTGKAKKHSDFDLVVVAKGPLTSPLLSLLKGDFEESNLPFRVDVLDWYAISGRFQSLILKKYEIIQECST